MAEACAGCGKPCPASSIDTTVISKFGWRVTRRKLDDGRDLVEVRCPACWLLHRQKLASSE
jgi:hypothetical protein